MQRSLLAVLALAGAAGAAPNLWPLPKSYTSGAAKVALDPHTFQFKADSPSAELAAGFERYTAQYFPRSVPAGVVGANAVVAATVTVKDDSAALQLGMDEAYTLSVGTDGAVAITAGTQYGAYHAMETLSQLIVFNATEKQYVIYDAPWSIEDAPRFAHREVLLDTSRHYQTVASLKNIIQSFTYAKVNTVHWHLVDQQAFAWLAPSAPELAQGSWSVYERYTQEDLIDIVAFARARGIRVVFEIDSPGHAASWCVSHPEVCPAKDCPMPLRPDVNATFELYEKLVKDIFSIAPDSYFHIGSDEVNTECWSKNADIKAWMDAKGIDEHGAFKYFVDRVTQIVQSHGKHVIGWDELWANFGSTLDKKTIIAQWRPWADATVAATAAGYNVIWSNDGPWYLDGLKSTWEDMYNAEPCAKLSDDACKLVLGGGGEMWGETVDASDIQATIWPRLAAIAERLWSPRDATKDASAAEPRIAYFRCYLNRQGVAAAPYNNSVGRSAPAALAAATHSERPQLSASGACSRVVC